jgi:hypothetical protein
MGVRLADVTDDATARAVAAELGIPADAPLHRVIIPGSGYGPAWTGFHVEMIGIPFTVQPGAPNPPGPAFRLGTVERGFDLVVQMWGQIVRHDDSGIYVQSRWHPEHGQTYSMHGLERPHRKPDVDRAWRSLGLIRLVERRGRTPDTSKAGVVDELHRAARAVRAQGRKPTVAALVDEMAVSRSKFHADAARFAIDWREEVRKADTG